MGHHRSFGAAAFVCLLVLGAPVASASDNLAKHHALSLVGTPKYGPDFTHFDWVNPNAPKGGRVRQWAMGTFDSLNQFPVKGSAAAGLTLIYDTLMTISPDEDLDRVRPARRMGVVSARLLLGDLSAAPASPLPRRQADHAGGRHLLARGHQEGLPQLRLLLQERDEGGEDRRPPGHLHFRRQGQPRAAGDRRRAADRCPSITGRALGANGEPRDLGKSTLEIPLGSGPYRIKEVDAGRTITLRARQGLVGQGPARHQGPVELRRDPLRLFPRPRAGLRGLQVRPARLLARESSAKAWATRSTSTPSSAGWSSWRRSRSPASRRCSRSPSTSAGRSSRIRACGRPSTWPSISSGPTRTCSTTSTARVGSYFDNSELKAQRPAAGARARDPQRGARPRCRRRSSPTEWKNPVNATPEDARKHLARPRSCWPRPAGRRRTAC